MTRTTKAQIEQALRTIEYSAEELGLQEKTKVGRYIVYPYDNMESRIGGNVALLGGIIDVFDETRERMGVPISITSGYRSPTTQRAMKRSNPPAVSRSPHSTGAAFDLGCYHLSATYGETWQERQEALKRHLEESADLLGLRPWLRVGYRSYRKPPVKTIVHVDIVPIHHPDSQRSNENPDHLSGMDEETWRYYLQLLKELPDVFFPWGRERNPSPTNWRGGVSW